MNYLSANSCLSTGRWSGRVDGRRSDHTYCLTRFGIQKQQYSVTKRQCHGCTLINRIYRMCGRPANCHTRHCLHWPLGTMFQTMPCLLSIGSTGVASNQKCSTLGAICKALAPNWLFAFGKVSLTNWILLDAKVKMSLVSKQLGTRLCVLKSWVHYICNGTKRSHVWRWKVPSTFQGPSFDPQTEQIGLHNKWCLLSIDASKLEEICLVHHCKVKNVHCNGHCYATNRSANGSNRKLICFQFAIDHKGSASQKYEFLQWR